ncbi:hypothetical protein EGW08_003804 [Elysia chlorotica]|uniref:BZIP domain-containing protein n=1 Tax=Elysia chlorotica TaxID=188477 RepID=A0A433U3Q8_ELYCH|nr:hypothetical protein EGW08_003804 [Elysia chlorotica]
MQTSDRYFDLGIQRHLNRKTREVEQFPAQAPRTSCAAQPMADPRPVGARSDLEAMLDIEDVVLRDAQEDDPSLPEAPTAERIFSPAFQDMMSNMNLGEDFLFNNVAYHDGAEAGSTQNQTDEDLVEKELINRIATDLQNMEQFPYQHVSQPEASGQAQQLFQPGASELAKSLLRENVLQRMFQEGKTFTLDLQEPLPETISPTDEDRAKEEARKKRNRLAAEKSRKKQKDMKQNLEMSIVQNKKEGEELKLKVLHDLKEMDDMKQMLLGCHLKTSSGETELCPRVFELFKQMGQLSEASPLLEHFDMKVGEQRQEESSDQMDFSSSHSLSSVQPGQGLDFSQTNAATSTLVTSSAAGLRYNGYMGCSTDELATSVSRVKCYDGYQANEATLLLDGYPAESVSTSTQSEDAIFTGIVLSGNVFPQQGVNRELTQLGPSLVLKPFTDRSETIRYSQLPLIDKQQFEHNKSISAIMSTYKLQPHNAEVGFKSLNPKPGTATSNETRSPTLRSAKENDNSSLALYEGLTLRDLLPPQPPPLQNNGQIHGAKVSFNFAHSSCNDMPTGGRAASASIKPHKTTGVGVARGGNNNSNRFKSIGLTPGFHQSASAWSVNDQNDDNIDDVQDLLDFFSDDCKPSSEKKPRLE